MFDRKGVFLCGSMVRRQPVMAMPAPSTISATIPIAACSPALMFRLPATTFKDGGVVQGAVDQ
jgi:hypothetical protein